MKKHVFIGFNLAEVLITLGIIGIVVIMTIPSLAKNIQDNQYKVAYKKALSTAAQAIQKANSEYLFVEQSHNQNPDVHKENFIIFMNQFKTIKQCLNNNNDQCWEKDGEDFCIDEYPPKNALAFIDSSGVAWSMFHNGGTWFLIDTNGFKKPNQWGKDRFAIKTNASDETASIVVHAMVLFPTIVRPFKDNDGIICRLGIKCATEKNYYGTSWLSQ